MAPTQSTIFPGNCPEDTDLEYQQSYTWLPYRGYCYLFIQDEIEWADAASSCVRHGKIHAEYFVTILESLYSKYVVLRLSLICVFNIVTTSRFLFLRWSVG